MLNSQPSWASANCDQTSLGGHVGLWVNWVLHASLHSPSSLVAGMMFLPPDYEDAIDLLKIPSAFYGVF